MRKRLVFLVFSVCAITAVSAQDLQKRSEPSAPVIAPAPGKAPNSNADYQALRNVTISGESASVSNFVLKRDAGVFTFKSGTFSFLAPIKGKGTGVVFQGDGSFDYVPPIDAEKRSLAYLTKEPAMHETFSELLIRFTDDTEKEIKQSSNAKVSATGGSAGILDEVNRHMKRTLHDNIAARILEYVLGENNGGMFTAFIKGKSFGGKLVYVVDPHGAGTEVAPEEVMLLNFDEGKYGIYSAHHLSEEYKNGTANGTQENRPFKVLKEDLSTTIEKGGLLQGDATVTVQALEEGVHVASLDLYKTLRVVSVTGEDGSALDFIQEDKNDDPDFVVILSRILKKGDLYSFRVVYGGKEAVINDGGGNFSLSPAARESWYPSGGFDKFANYHMTFKIPKGLKLVATGTPVKDVEEGNYNVSEWTSDVPLSTAGFTFGKFKLMEAKTSNYLIQARANEGQPDWVASLQTEVNGTLPGQREAAVTLGTMATTDMMKKPFAEAQISTDIYTDYFGPSSFKRISMTQQTYCNFGQSWPVVVWIPICAFFDTTVRHQLGLDDTRGYWTVVGPHEVAHQWWGNTVGSNSYRDYWMVEGFADFSASLYIQAVYPNKIQEFTKFWNDEKYLITEKNKFGFRAIDVGPLTLGYRNNNGKVGGNVTRNLIYPKGAYVLHMVRMMMLNMRDPKGADNRFKETMHDYVETYRNKPASTEDFKAMVEKHMTREMDLDNNHKMDWFFNPFVYGTEMPDFHFDSNIENGADGVTLKFTLKQGSVSDKFKMMVPIYLELANGRTVKLGAANVTGNNAITQSVPLGKMDAPPKRALINYYNDVLCTIDGK